MFDQDSLRGSGCVLYSASMCCDCGRFAFHLEPYIQSRMRRSVEGIANSYSFGLSELAFKGKLL